MASYQASSPRVTTIKKDCRTSIGSHFSLSLGRVRMVASLPFPVLSKEQIRLRMNLERCPLEIKLIILLQVIQNKIDMFQTWDEVSMLFYRKVFFFPSKSLVCLFFFLSVDLFHWCVTAQRTKQYNPQVDQSHDWQKNQAVQKSTQAFGKFFVLSFFYLTLNSTF